GLIQHHPGDRLAAKTVGGSRQQPGDLADRDDPVSRLRDSASLWRLTLSPALRGAHVQPAHVPDDSADRGGDTAHPVLFDPAPPRYRSGAGDCLYDHDAAIRGLDDQELRG